MKAANASTTIKETQLRMVTMLLPGYLRNLGCHAARRRERFCESVSLPIASFGKGRSPTNLWTGSVQSASKLASLSNLTRVQADQTIFAAVYFFRATANLSWAGF
jgi:hypothetical protein